MPTARPFAYNTGSPIPGTLQIGDLAIGVDPLDYSTNPGGVQWWNGPDEDLGYVIAHPTPAGDQPNPLGIPAYLGFWRSEFLTETSFIGIAQYVSNQHGSPQTFTTGSSAKTWLNDNGYWTSYDEIQPLVYLNSGINSSYSGSGSVWYDLEGVSNNATLVNTPTYSSNFQGILSFDDTSSEYATIPNLGDLNQWTVEVWFRISKSLTGKVSSLVTNQYNLATKLNFSVGTNNAHSSYNLVVGFFDGAWRNTTGFVPSLNTWYQVVGTYDGSVLRQYVNGTASGGTLNYVGTPQSGGEVRLMRRWDDTVSSGNLIAGDLAIVKIYNQALSDSDILDSYNNTYTRFVELTPTPTPSVTPTLTPTITPTITPTPTPSPSPAGGIVTSNLFMKLDATNYTSGTWNDETANGNNATINGATWLSDDGGIFDLDGLNDNISIPHNSSLSLSTTQQRTIQVWVKFDTLPALNTQGQPVFGKLSSSFGFDGYWGGLFSNTGTVRVVTNGAATQRVTTSTLTITTGTWYLYTFISQITSTSNTTKVYINTTEYGSTAHGSDTYTETNPLYLGYIGDGVSSPYLNGKIGACYFYTSGLSLSDITTNYNTTKSKYGL
jgi:hypothetical protein